MFSKSFVPLCCAVAVSFCALPVTAADAELDALNLEGTPEVAPAGSANLRFFFEGALGDASQRYLPDRRNIGRASVDMNYQTRLTPGVRAVFSDRLDYFDPVLANTDDVVNSLREAYLSWQSDGGNSLLELGRINLRYGPSYGYNPTDFFRAGSLRVLTTADPFALRENRLGTVLLRGQYMWLDNAFSVALAPKLADTASTNGWNLDLGATNSRDRAVLMLSTQFSKSVTGQTLLYKQAGQSTVFGFNMAALLSDAATAHLEFTHSSEPSLLDRSLGASNVKHTRNRVSGGVTYTTLGKLSLTAEYQYNGFALNQADWSTLGSTPSIRLGYLSEALRLQELAARQSYLIYVTQKGIGQKDLDLTAYLRFNPGDDSRLFWIELRRHWPNFDLSFQLQHNTGNSNSEFGLLPDARVVHVVGTYYH